MTEKTPNAAEIAAAERRKSAIYSAIPGLLLKESTASLMGRDNFPKRVPARDEASLQEKKDFFDQAHPDGTLSADWRTVTHTAAQFVPKGGTVVDLGGSAGQYAKFLALSRNDVKVIAIEPDPDKYRMAQEEIQRMGLGSRISMMKGPVPEALNKLSAAGAQVSAITSIYRTHLQTDAENIKDMQALRRLSENTGASVVFHDLHRPFLNSTATTMSSIFPADDATDKFRQGYADAMKGSYRDTEMRNLLSQHLGGQPRRDMPASPMGPSQMQQHVVVGHAAPKLRTAPLPQYPPTKDEYAEVASTLNGMLARGLSIDPGTPPLANDTPSDRFNSMKPASDQQNVIVPAALKTQDIAPEKARRPSPPSAGPR